MIMRGLKLQEAIQLARRGEADRKRDGHAPKCKSRHSSEVEQGPNLQKTRGARACGLEG
jgi:hypothetical protein